MMLRTTIFKTQKADPIHGFELRGKEVKRIETLSDAVFAFAVTLLIVSLEVPKTFEELLVSMRGFVAFAICFTFLMLVWHEQNVFFRRYGLDDLTSVFLNGFLLFIVLFYVYPLKFLFSMLFSEQIYPPGKNPFYMKDEQLPQLMLIYGVGYVAIYSIFFLLYLHASRKRLVLQLSRVELFDTWTRIYQQLIMIGIGLGSILLALTLPLRQAGASGLFYFMIGPVSWIIRWRRSVLRRHLLKQA